MATAYPVAPVQLFPPPPPPPALDRDDDEVLNDAPPTSPSDEGADDQFNPQNYDWEFRPPGIQDVQSLVDFIINNEREDDGNTSDTDGVHVKRIPNKFFVYRSHFLRAYRNVVDPASGMPSRPVPQRHISKLAGHVWKEVLNNDQREPYRLAYLQLKVQFDAAHPDYRYRPKSKEEKARMKEKQKVKKAEQAEVRRAEKKARQDEDNRRRLAAGYTHRAWRKLKKAVRAGMPDPLAATGGCIDPAALKGDDSDDERDDQADVPDFDAPALPAHLTGQVLQAVQLLEKNDDMRASQAWQITAPLPGVSSAFGHNEMSGHAHVGFPTYSDQNAIDHDGISGHEQIAVPSNSDQFSNLWCQEPYMGLPPDVSLDMEDFVQPLPDQDDDQYDQDIEMASEEEDIELYQDPESISPADDSEAEAQPMRSSFSGPSSRPIRPLPHRDETTGLWEGIVESAGPAEEQIENLYGLVTLKSLQPDTDSVKMQHIEQSLIFSETPPRQRTIEFGRTDPSQFVMSTPIGAASAKRRAVMRDPSGSDDSPSSGRGVPSDPIRSVDMEQEMSSARDAVRSPATPESGERMAPPSAGSSPFQRIPASFRPRFLRNPDEIVPEWLNRGPRSSFSKASGFQALGKGMPGKGKRTLSPDAQGGRSRQPSLVIGHVSPDAPGDHSRQPSMVVALVNGVIKLVNRDMFDNAGDSSDSPGNSSGTSLLSDPSDELAELLGQRSFDTDVPGQEFDDGSQLAGLGDKDSQAYHWLGPSLTGFTDDVDGGVSGSHAPRMSFSEFMSSFPNTFAPDPEALQSLQTQLDEGFVDEETFQQLLAYNGYHLTLEE